MKRQVPPQRSYQYIHNQSRNYMLQMNESLVFALLILLTFVRIFQTLNGFRQFSLLFHVPAHMFQGEIDDGLDVLVRVHSECLIGDIFGATCQCGNQLELALKQIEAAGRGVLVYLRGNEGRGIGLSHMVHACPLEDDKYEELQLPVDSREYGIGAQILRDPGVHTIRFMTKYPAEYDGLKGYGLTVAGEVPLLTPH